MRFGIGYNRISLDKMTSKITWQGYVITKLQKRTSYYISSRHLTTISIPIHKLFFLLESYIKIQIFLQVLQLTKPINQNQTMAIVCNSKKQILFSIYPFELRDHYYIIKIKSMLNIVSLTFWSLIYSLIREIISLNVTLWDLSLGYC